MLPKVADSCAALVACFTLLIGALPVAVASADVVTLAPIADNTLFSTDGNTSNGAGPAVFCGRTGANGGGTMQRGVLRFDVAGAVPAGSTVITASLTLQLDSSGAMATHSIALHRLRASWGEGTSVAGGGQGAPSTPDDATWLHTFFPDEFWDAPGGDFAPGASASTSAGFESGSVTWTSTPGLVADVQAWLGDPATNHGWLLLGNEAEFSTARRFFSREAEAPGLRPALAIEFAPVSACPTDLDADGDVGFSDLVAVLSAFGACGPCPEDLDDDGIVGSEDLNEVIVRWGPCP